MSVVVVRFGEEPGVDDARDYRPAGSAHRTSGLQPGRRGHPPADWRGDDVTWRLPGLSQWYSLV